MSSKVSIVGTAVTRRDELIINVYRACRNCGAPGFWHNTPGVNVGCYAPERVTMLGQDPVGTICPNCGAAREAVDPYGVVWFKEWRVSLWAVIQAIIRETIRGFQPKWRI
jgi:hypothetical protein